MTTPLQRTERLAAVGLALLLGITAGPGCRSVNPAGTKAAAGVVIEGRSIADIRQAAMSVFVEEHFNLTKAHDRQVVFEKRASRGSDFAYGGWLSGATFVRAKLEIQDRSTTSRILECNVYIVSHPGDQVFEEEQKPFKQNRSYYQKLLDRVKAICEERASTPPPSLPDPR